MNQSSTSGHPRNDSVLSDPCPSGKDASDGRQKLNYPSLKTIAYTRKKDLKGQL